MPTRSPGSCWRASGAPTKDRAPKRVRGIEAESWQDVDRDLFERLRAVRLEIARARGVPPYVIFHDTTLRDMARAEADDARRAAQRLWCGRAQGRGPGGDVPRRDQTQLRDVLVGRDGATGSQRRNGATEACGSLRSGTPPDDWHKLSPCNTKTRSSRRRHEGNERFCWTSAVAASRPLSALAAGSGASSANGRHVKECMRQSR